MNNKKNVMFYLCEIELFREILFMYKSNMKTDLYDNN